MKKERKEGRTRVKASDVSLLVHRWSDIQVGGTVPQGYQTGGLFLQVGGKYPGGAMMNRRSVVTIGINALAELRPELR